MRYEDVVALRMFSLGLTAADYKTHKMMIETGLHIRSDHDQKKSFWRCVNSGMRENAFSAQELQKWSALRFWEAAI